MMMPKIVLGICLMWMPWAAAFVTPFARPAQSTSSVATNPLSSFSKEHWKNDLVSLSATLEATPTTLPIGAEKTSKSFPWFKNWYAMGVESQLEEGRPHEINLLGKRLVLWYNGKEWSALDDACPHRMAPLSEGRVEKDGTLLCAYHAWRFTADGSCVSLPQLGDKPMTADLSSRACAKAYPTTVRHGVIFVWPESGPDAFLESALTEPYYIKDLDDPTLKGRLYNMAYNTRDLPYGWDYFIDNVLDAAHAGVTHHKIIGSRYDVKKMSVKITKSLPNGTIVGETSMEGSPNETTVTFTPPTHVEIRTKTPNGAQSMINLYAAPNVPGRCYHVGSLITVAGPNGEKASTIAPKLPVSLGHIFAHIFLNQDGPLLHKQQYIMATNDIGVNKKKSYTSATLDPAATDAMVHGFRRWYASVGGVQWPDGVDQTIKLLSDDELFDTYDAHTKNCKQCSAALKSYGRAANGLTVASAVTAALGITQARVPVLAAATVGGAAVIGLQKLRGTFRKMEYRAQDNN